MFILTGHTLNLVNKVMKGQKGEPGNKGAQGKIGRVGNPGEPGPVGPPGDVGDTSYFKPQSAFCVSRSTSAYPEPGKPIIFQNAITNVAGHFNVLEGKFVCHIPGTYYFVYHASLYKKTLCVKLMVDGRQKASFCDHIQDEINVSSGGLAVYLQHNSTVWLMTYERVNGMYAAGEKGNTVFSGFLLFAH